MLFDDEVRIVAAKPKGGDGGTSGPVHLPGLRLREQPEGRSLQGGGGLIYMQEQARACRNADAIVVTVGAV